MSERPGSPGPTDASTTLGATTSDSNFGRTRPELEQLRGSCVVNRVSVIIPCFNNECFVGAAIESAIDQSWPDIEIVVVDDGSTDGSRGVIESFGDRIITRWLNHGGAPAARNKGLASASGEFIQFLDADDLLLTDAIERRIGEFNDDLDAVFGDLEFFDQRNQQTIRTVSHTGWPEPEPLAHLIRHNIHTETPLHRRRLLYSIGGFDEGFPCSQELNLHIRLNLAGACFSHLPGTVARARVHQSPNRIENAPWYVNNPDLHLSIIDHHRRLITDGHADLLTPAVLQALAFKLWSRGMIAGRNGATDVAHRYFEYARRYSSTLEPEGSALFRFFHALLGPNMTARAMRLKQRLSNRLGMTSQRRR